jgi:hypothetical protein
MMTVGQFIRDVGTLSDAALRAYLVSHDPEQDPTAHLAMATAALEEMLRRERDRCAAVLQAKAAECLRHRNSTAWHQLEGDYDLLTQSIADIRGLQ